MNPGRCFISVSFWQTSLVKNGKRVLHSSKTRLHMKPKRRFIEGRFRPQMKARGRRHKSVNSQGQTDKMFHGGMLRPRRLAYPTWGAVQIATPVLLSTRGDTKRPLSPTLLASGANETNWDKAMSFLAPST